MISSVLAVAMAAYMQPADTTRASREAFTACLRTYVERSSNARMSASDFAAAYPQQCTAEQTAYRDAVIRREIASRSSRSDAEESAGLEIEDQRTNFSERFDMYVAAPASAQTQTAAAPASAATPAAAPATPAATQAAVATPAPAATPPAQPAVAQTTPH
jgi:1-aminocyclopropane-1-carboxylate deaminase/D-cysteine desulfhydrase-like pyridoxal-dependent ACC family enzyme